MDDVWTGMVEKDVAGDDWCHFGVVSPWPERRDRLDRIAEDRQ